MARRRYALAENKTLTQVYHVDQTRENGEGSPVKYRYVQCA
jgi:hypothetical protein